MLVLISHPTSLLTPARRVVFNSKEAMPKNQMQVQHRPDVTALSININLGMKVQLWSWMRLQEDIKEKNS